MYNGSLYNVQWKSVQSTKKSAPGEFPGRCYFPIYITYFLHQAVAFPACCTAAC